MDYKYRRTYRTIALAFVGIGLAFLVVALLESVLEFELFNASPIRIALLVLGIGGLLWWTVRDSPE
jgi:FtsH-binding integral membrane protein